MTARLSRNCAEAKGAAVPLAEHTTEGRACSGCDCPCHAPPVDASGARLAAPGALREAYRAARAGEDVRIPLTRAGEGA
jgi:hypothetical protein